MFMTPPLYLDYIPVFIMKRIEFENIYSVFRPITYTMCKYNREKITNTQVVLKKKALQIGCVQRVGQ